MTPELSKLNVTFISHSFPQSSGAIAEEETERFQESKGRKDRSKLGSLDEHDGIIVFTNSQQLWLAAQDLYRIKPVNIPALMEEKIKRPPPLAEQLLTVDRL